MRDDVISIAVNRPYGCPRRRGERPNNVQWLPRACRWSRASSEPGSSPDGMTARTDDHIPLTDGGIGHFSQVFYRCKAIIQMEQIQHQFVT